MKIRHRIAAALGYMPTGAVIQGSISFNGEDRAHVSLRVPGGGYWLVGEVDVFTEPGASERLT